MEPLETKIVRWALFVKEIRPDCVVVYLSDVIRLDIPMDTTEGCRIGDVITLKAEVPCRLSQIINPTIT